MAIEEGEATLTPNGKDARPHLSHYSVTYVRRDRKWLQAAVRDDPNTKKPLTPHDHLHELSWMVGEWVNESDDNVVFSSCDWVDNKNFLLRSFTVQVAGKHAMSGTQRIGWDPLTKRIQSWVFDTEGGHAEGFWTRDGDRWVVKSTGVTSDGRAASSTTVITHTSKDKIHWEMIDHTVGGQALLGGYDFYLVRKPPQPK